MGTEALVEDAVREVESEIMWASPSFLLSTGVDGVQYGGSCCREEDAKNVNKSGRAS